MSSIAHKSLRKTSLPRTGRELDAVSGGPSSAGGGSSSGSGGIGSVPDHSQLTGVICTEDKYPDSARDIHLTAAAAKSLDKLSSLEIIKLDDKDTEPTDDNLFSASRTLYEIRKKIEDNTVTLDARYIRKDIDSFANGNIEFRKNIFVQGEAALTNALIVESLYSDIDAAAFDATGFHLSANGDAWLNNIYAKKDSYFKGNLSSPDFSSGFPAGYGWALTWRDVVNAAGVAAKKTHLEIDDLTVRGILRIYEMVISQLLGESGTHLTADMMKIKSVDREKRIIYLDTEEGVLYNPFWTDDVLMVQRFNGMPSAENDHLVTKQYELVVEETGIGSLDADGERVDWIKYKNFVGDESLITGRDTLVRVDNLTNVDRKGIIKQTSVEPGSPYMDIIYAMKTDPVNAIRARFGKLDGLITSYWGQLDGYGLMCDNAYLRGRFMLHTGEDVKTKFEVMEGLFRSEIESVKTQISSKDNYLANASFSVSTDKWTTTNEQNVFSVGNRILMFNANLYANKKKIAAVTSDSGKKVLRIKNSAVRQANGDLANKPKLEVPEEGEVLIPTFYVSLQYKCVIPGLLKVGFTGKELFSSESITASSEYITKEFSGKWDGTGDFVVECTGDVYVSMLALTTDALADFEIKMKTIIEQTEEHIKLLGEKVDKNAGTIVNLGIELNNVTESIKLYATKATVNDLESRYQASMLELTPSKINLMVTEQITRVSDEAMAAAIDVANKAQESANKGIADAKAAGDRLTGWASDGTISPTEKLTLKQEAKDLASQKEAVIADAGKYGISTTGYVNAYNAYLGELNYHSNTTPENIAIRTTFATYQAAYYNARQAILNLIATKTKQSAEDYADAAKAAAVEVANKAQQSADKGILDAKAAGDRLTGWASDGTISPPEKLTLKQEAKDLASQKEAIIADAGKYTIATTGYVSAYNNYLGELNYHSTVAPENIAIRSTFAAYQAAYYNARQSILDQIATKTKQAAKDYADSVGTTLTASLTLEKNRIDALVGKFDANGKLIEGAGWITTSKGNELWANKKSFDTLTQTVSEHSSKFNVNSSWISGLVSRVTGTENDIASIDRAGFITKADGNSWWVTTTDYTGTSIVGKINQTAEGTKILASKVEFNAYNNNLIRNSGNCKNTAYWTTNGGGSAPYVSGGSIRANFASSGSLINNSLKGIKLMRGRKYTVRVSLYSSTALNAPMWITASDAYHYDFNLKAGDGEYKWTFTASSDIDAEYFRIYIKPSSTIMVNWVKLEEGEYATAWTPNPSDSIYSTDSDLIAALNGTTIQGGLQLTTRIKLGLLSGGVWSEQGGISANTDNIMLWAGSTYEQAKAGIAKTILYHDGTIKATGIFETAASGRRISINPNNTDRLLGLYEGTNLLGKFGFDPENLYAYLEVGANNSWHTSVSTAGITHGSGQAGIFTLANTGGRGGLMKFFFRAAWLNANEAWSGEVYKDDSGYLRVK